MIRYLEPEEKQLCRPLWEEAFPEDTREFLDNYFERKMKENRVLAALDGESGGVLSMIHLNPYELVAGDRRFKADYLVACATARRVRGQGYNRELVNRLLADLYREGAPVTFLAPAIPERYRKVGFEYVSLPPEARLRQETPVTARPLPRGDTELYADVALWMNRWLGERFQVYAHRDAAYVENLVMELASDDGVLEQLFLGDERIGLRAFWGRTKREQRLLYCTDGSLTGEYPCSGPGIMARVVNAPAFLSGFGVNGDCPCQEMEVPLVIRDPQIEENNGLFCWRLNANGSMLRRPGASGGVGPDGAGLLVSSEALALTPGQLAAWLWGYRTLEELEPDSGIPYWCGFVRTLKGVFLDEVV